MPTYCDAKKPNKPLSNNPTTTFPPQVYESRLNMGEMLARKILRLYPDHDIDVVIPVPDTSRTSGLSCAYTLGR